MESIHFIGVGGVGMNGLAQLAAHSGAKVSGSDRGYDAKDLRFQQLEACGIRFVPQDGSGIVGANTKVVYSTAIEDDNPDLVKARSQGCPLLHRSEFLKERVGKAPLIAVAGTAGKTTTTGLLGWIFEYLDLDPSVYNGAAVVNWRTASVPGNVRTGGGIWIIEADESDKSFLQFHPNHAIITNISKDHYELNELHAMFNQFRKQTAGTIIEYAPLPPPAGQPNQFIYQNITFTVPLIGKHNLENAFAAIRLCAALQMDLKKVRDALATFQGIERRLEQVGSFNGISVLDDYAHNPAKMDAAIEAVKQTATQVHAYWRPHGFTPLYQCKDELAAVLAKHFPAGSGATIHILPVYYAGGTVNKLISSEEFVQQLQGCGTNAAFAENYAQLKQKLLQHAHPNDAILGMGARDPELPRFSRALLR